MTFSAYGVSSEFISSFFNLLSKYENILHYFRKSGSTNTFFGDEITLAGTFDYRFIQSFSKLKPEISSITFRIDNSDYFKNELLRYSCFTWELEKNLYLGNTVLTFDFLNQILGIKNDNLLFLKLLLSTPAVSELKHLLLTKPKGVLSIKDDIITFFLPNQTIDFLFHWMKKVEQGQTCDLNWISGSSGELPPELQQSEGIPSSIVESLESWLSLAKLNVLNDYELIFHKAIKLTGARLN